MITEAGKSVTRHYLAGTFKSFAKAIGIGVGQSDPSDLDTELDFEYIRLPIVVGAVRNESEIVYKATLPEGVAVTISEVGLFSFESNPGSGKFTGTTISEFADYEGWLAVDGGNLLTVNGLTYGTRIGQNSLMITNLADGGSKTYSSTPSQIDLSGYSLDDKIKVSLKQQDVGVSSITLVLRDTSGAVASYDYDMPTYSALQEYIVLSAKISDFFSNEFLWGSVVDVSVIIEYNDTSENSTVILDSIKVFDSDSFSKEYSMIGRVVLDEPITKQIGSPLDVEYSVSVTL